MEQAKMMKCPLCPYKTNRRGVLNVHIRSHTGEKPFKCQHPKCPASFSSSSSLRKHYQLVHRKEKKFECSICSKKFGQKHHLIGHKKIHGNEKPFCCSVCSFQTKRAAGLKDHMKFIHSDEKPFACGQCPYKSKLKSQLKRHMRVHLDSVAKEKVKKHRCPHCPYKSIEIRTMRNHIRTHTGEKPFCCPHCGLKAIRSMDLKIHIAYRHTREKKIKCKLCDYATVASGQLARHIRSHTGEKPYKCKFPDCHYAASASDNLQKHELIHRDEKLFKCDQCPFLAIQKSNMNRHRKVCHSSSIPHAKGRCQGTTRKGLQGIKNHRCRVAGCKYVSRMEKGLALHLNEIHQLPIILLKVLTPLTIPTTC